MFFGRANDLGNPPRRDVQRKVLRAVRGRVYPFVRRFLADKIVKNRGLSTIYPLI